MRICAEVINDPDLEDLAYREPCFAAEVANLMHPVLAAGPSDQVRVRGVADADVVPEGSPAECDVIGPKTLIARPGPARRTAIGDLRSR